MGKVSQRIPPQLREALRAWLRTYFPGQDVISIRRQGSSYHMACASGRTFLISEKDAAQLPVPNVRDEGPSDGEDEGDSEEAGEQQQPQPPPQSPPNTDADRWEMAQARCAEALLAGVEHDDCAANIEPVCNYIGVEHKGQCHKAVRVMVRLKLFNTLTPYVLCDAHAHVAVANLGTGILVAD